MIYLFKNHLLKKWLILIPNFLIKKYVVSAMLET